MRDRPSTDDALFPAELDRHALADPARLAIDSSSRASTFARSFDLMCVGLVSGDLDRPSSSIPSPAFSNAVRYRSKLSADRTAGAGCRFRRVDAISERLLIGSVGNPTMRSVGEK
eukprot:2044221-Rhodomonas_salina.2